jgi:hypothetical protein
VRQKSLVSGVELKGRPRTGKQSDAKHETTFSINWQSRPEKIKTSKSLACCKRSSKAAPRQKPDESEFVSIDKKTGMTHLVRCVLTMETCSDLGIPRCLSTCRERSKSDH